MINKITNYIDNNTFFRIYLFFTALMCIITFIVYGIDKLIAVINGKNRLGSIRRVPEKILLTLAVFGGSIGALCGMILFRHKIRKIRFVVAVPVFIAIWAAAGAAIIYFGK